MKRAGAALLTVALLSAQTDTKERSGGTAPGVITVATPAGHHKKKNTTTYAVLAGFVAVGAISAAAIAGAHKTATPSPYLGEGGR